MTLKNDFKILKIGIFTDAYKPLVNGVVKSIETLYKGLLELNHRVYIFAPSYKGYTDDNEDVYRFKSINFSSKVNYPLSIPYSRRIFNIMKSLDLDIVHCHHPFLIGRLGMYFARRLEIPVVATLHTQYENYNHYIPLNKSFIKNLTLWALRDFSKKCDGLIIPTESRKKQLIDYGILSDNIKVIPNSIELDRFRTLDRDIVRLKYSILPDEILLLFVGRLAKEKNLDFLLNCCKGIFADNSHVKLMFVGDGPESFNLKRKVEEDKLTKKVIFTGEVDYKYIANYYAASDIFVSTSTTEVHPLVLLEAMACGLPVVSFHSTGYEDTVRNGVDGILCEEKTEDFTNAVKYIMNNDDIRKNMSFCARERAEAFSQNNIINDVLDLYLSLIKN